MTAPLRFSANISLLFAELPFLDRFAAAASAGFPAVEIQSPFEFSPQDMRERLDAAGLVLNHLNTRPGGKGEFGLAARPGREDDFARVMDEALTYARHLGARTIHVMSGCVEPHERERARETFIANMRKASAMADGLDVALCIEPINSRDRPGYFVSRSDEIVDLLHDVDRPNVKLLFDFYHIQIMEGDLVQRMERHWPQIGHFQFAGVPERHEPDRAEINYPRIFQEIAARNWSGWVGAEYRPRAGTLEGLGWLREMAPA